MRLYIPTYIKALAYAAQSEGGSQMEVTKVEKWAKRSLIKR